MVLTTAAKLDDTTLVVQCGSDVAIDQTVSMGAKQQLRIDADGNGKMIIKPRVRLTDKQLAEVVKLTLADVRVTITPAQMDIADMTTVTFAARGGDVASMPVLFHAADDDAQPAAPKRKKQA